MGWGAHADARYSEGWQQSFEVVCLSFSFSYPCMFRLLGLLILVWAGDLCAEDGVGARGNSICFHCKKHGHTINNCFVLN